MTSRVKSIQDIATLPLFERQAFTTAVKTLRPYQVEAIHKLRAHATAGRKRVLLTLPTGGGKMVLAASIIKTSSLPVLFVCHRMELIDQCANELEALGVTNIGVIRSDDPRTNPAASTQLASIQTLSRRALPKAGILLVDEAHRSMSDQYRELFAEYPDAIIIGFTATPCRLDSKPLGEVYPILEIVASYSELIKRGHVVAPEIWAAPVQADLSGVRTVHGDYEESTLAEVMSQTRLVGQVVDHWLRLSGRYSLPGVGNFEMRERRHTFLFAVNIRHSLALCERFREAGVRVAHLDGKTPENERRAMLRDIAAGQLEIISNVNVLLEGVDVPSVKCVVHARPTQSLVLWIQSVGRSLRPWNGVTPLLLDHAGNTDRHDPPHMDRAWSLLTKPVRKAAQGMKLCKQCFAYVESGLEVCPFCGYVFERNTAPKAIVETQQELVPRQDVSPEQIQKAFYDSYVEKAKQQGFKPGFASARFKDKYGKWPPWAWSDATRATFASDPAWQVRLARREEERKAWEPEEKKKRTVADEVREVLERVKNGSTEPAPVAEEPSAVTDPFANEAIEETSDPDDFASWWDGQQ